MKELPKKWRMVLTVALFVVPFFTILRGIGTENSDLIVLAVWFFLFGGFALNRVSPQFAKDGSKVKTRMSFLQACQDKEVWIRGFKRYWIIDLGTLVAAIVFLNWGLPWGGVLGFVCFMVVGKIEQSRRELDELRSRA
ncbi:hypothetical protein [uncultured Ruegeria sp.]|uniref:hypothetical protein n=2 Tax=uncultured Ruegeria sp. TaxID=259304 RepID=UPI00262AA22B|nr:hypothetical protein [uncultured Ruegeria sp.]